MRSATSRRRCVSSPRLKISIWSRGRLSQLQTTTSDHLMSEVARNSLTTLNGSRTSLQSDAQSQDLLCAWRKESSV